MTTLLTLARISLDLGQVHRATLHMDGRTRESDTTHSIMLALVALELVEEHQLPLDRGLLTRLALVHDLPEIYAGDTDTLIETRPDQQAAKAAREAQALERLRDELGDQHWLVVAIETYERQEVPEARFLRYLDKGLPRLTNTLNGCAAVRARGLGLDDLRAKTDAQDVELAQRYPEWAELLGGVLGEAGRAAEAAWTGPTGAQALNVLERARALLAKRSAEPAPPEDPSLRPTRHARTYFDASQVLEALVAGLPALERGEGVSPPPEGWPQLDDAITVCSLDLRERLTLLVGDQKPLERLLWGAYHAGVDNGMRQRDLEMVHVRRFVATAQACLVRSPGAADELLRAALANLPGPAPEGVERPGPVPVRSPVSEVEQFRAELAELADLASDLFDGAPVTPAQALRRLHEEAMANAQAALRVQRPRSVAPAADFTGTAWMDDVQVWRDALLLLVGGRIDHLDGLFGPDLVAAALAQGGGDSAWWDNLSAPEQARWLAQQLVERRARVLADACPVRR